MPPLVTARGSVSASLRLLNALSCAAARCRFSASGASSSRPIATRHATVTPPTSTLWRSASLPSSCRLVVSDRTFAAYSASGTERATSASICAARARA